MTHSSVKSVPIEVGLLTVSDRCSRGESEDTSGANVKNILQSTKEFLNTVVIQNIVADEQSVIETTLKSWSDQLHLGLIVTIGGTGFARRDVTPEATKNVIDKETPGLSLAMLKGSLEITPMAMLSRSVCGIRGNTLIVNLPGSKKASEECLRIILPTMSHATALLKNETAQVEATHASMRGDCNHCSKSSCSDIRTEGQIAYRARKSPYPAIPVTKALEIVIRETQIQESEMLDYKDALGRIVAADVVAKDPLPPFPASVKDGYAVISADGIGKRKVLGESSAGSLDFLEVKPGYCIRINTGAPVPNGADAVVQVEDTELVEASEDGVTEIEVNILKAPILGQDIRPVGCDIHVGEMVLKASTKITSFELGVLAAAGRTKVPVYKTPKIAVISTGNELMSPEMDLLPGHIRDSNTITLTSLLQEHGFSRISTDILRDNPEEIERKLKVIFESTDIIISTGGVSMGDKDFLKQVLKTKFNAEIHFGRVFMKPGLPTTFATLRVNNKKKLIFCLPGNPVSATVTFHLFVLPALYHMTGHVKPPLTKIKAKLGFDIKMLDLRPEYQRVFVSWSEEEDLQPIVKSTGPQHSSRLLSMAGANALLVLPGRSQNITKIDQNSIVDVLILHSL